MRHIKSKHSSCHIEVISYNEPSAIETTMISQRFHVTNFIKSVVQVFF